MISGAFVPLGMLGGILVAAGGHLLYLKLRRQPCRRIFYWYYVTALMYGGVLVSWLLFVGLIGIAWVTVVIVSLSNDKRKLPTRYWGTLGFGLLLPCAVLSTLPLLLGSIGMWDGLIAYWVLGMGFIFIDRSPRRRSNFRERFMFAFSGRGYAAAQAETEGTPGAKFRKAFSILLENHAIRLPFQVKNPQDEVKVFIDCKYLRPEN
jgi:hypothetical protein